MPVRFRPRAPKNNDLSDIQKCSNSPHSLLAAIRSQNRVERPSDNHRRGRIMASFIPRKGPNGKRVWQAHIRRRGYPAQVRTFDSKAAAQAWAAGIEHDIDRGVFVSRAEAEGTPQSDALQRYLAEITPTKKATTIARERNRVKVLMDLPLSRRSPLLQTPFP